MTYQNDFAEYGDLFGRYAREFFSPYFPEDDTGKLSQDFEIHQSKNRYIVSGELPDLTEDEISLSFRNNTLLIEGMSDDEEIYQNISHAIMFEDAVDPDSIEATYQNGELRIMLAKNNGEISQRKVKIPLNRATH